MITIDCHYNLKEDIHFILEIEKNNILELSERTVFQEPLPNDEVLKDIFGIVNEGCDSKQIIDFIAKTTGHRIKETK